MGSMSAVLAVAVAVLLGVGIWVPARQAIKDSQLTLASAREASAAEERESAPMYRSEARASLTALLVGVAATGLTWQVGTWWSQGYGLPCALAASAGAVAGLTAYNLYLRTMWDSPPGERTHAELTPRGPASFARQWMFALPLAAAIALILGLALTG